MTDLFISYSRNNIEFARQLVNSLLEQNYTHEDIWIDWDDIPASADWWHEIEIGIESSDNFVFILSPDSLSSKVCADELAYAVSLNKRLIPIIYIEPPKTTPIPPELRKYNWIFFIDKNAYDISIKKLVEALVTDIEFVHLHTRLLQRAIEWDSKAREVSFLLTGLEIIEAEKLIIDGQIKRPEPLELQIQYIDQSRILNKRRRQRSRSLFIGLLIAVTVGIFSIIFATRSTNSLADVQRREESARNAQATTTAELGNAQRAQATIVAQQATAEAQRAIAIAQQSTAAFEREIAVAGEATAVAERESSDAIARDSSRMSVALNLSDKGREFLLSNEGNPEVAALLALHSLRTLYTEAGDRLLLDSVKRLHTIRFFTGHSESINVLIFNKTGNLLLSGGDDGLLKLWDVTRDEPIQTFVGHSDSVSSAAFSSDDTMIVSGSADNSIRLWDTNTGELLRIFEGHLESVNSVALSPDGTQVVSGSSDGTVRLWDAKSSELLHIYEGKTLFDDQKNYVGTVTFTPDSKNVLAEISGYSILSQTGLKHIYIWNLATHELSLETPISALVNSVVLSPDGKMILIGDNDSNLLFWDISLKRTVKSYEHPFDVYNVSISSDGKFALSESGGSIYLWSTETDNIINVFRENTDRVNALTISPHAKWFASTAGNNIRLWHVEPQELTQIFRDHAEQVWTVAFSPDGTNFVSGGGTIRGNDTALRVWDTVTGRVIKRFEGHTDMIYSAAYSPDGTQIVSGSRDGSVRLWDLSQSEPVFVISGQAATFVAFNQTGNIFLSSNGDEIKLWDTSTGAQLYAFTGLDRITRSSVESTDGTQSLSISNIVNLVLRDTSTGEVIREYAHPDTITDFAFSIDGTHILSENSDGIVRIWDVSSHDLLENFPSYNMQSWASARRALSTELSLAASYENDVIRIWNVRNDEVQRIIARYGDEISSMAFSPDGTTILGGSLDGNIYL
jgi:WD40 repeat protein